MKRLLAKFGWELVRRFDPVRYEFYIKAIREVARQLVEGTSPSETPSMKSSRQVPDDEWLTDDARVRKELRDGLIAGIHGKPMS